MSVVNIIIHENGSIVVNKCRFSHNEFEDEERLQSPKLRREKEVPHTVTLGLVTLSTLNLSKEEKKKTKINERKKPSLIY